MAKERETSKAGKVKPMCMWCGERTVTAVVTSEHGERICARCAMEADE